VRPFRAGFANKPEFAFGKIKICDIITAEISQVGGFSPIGEMWGAVIIS
jgi:hypothetical protein